MKLGRSVLFTNREAVVATRSSGFAIGGSGREATAEVEVEW